MKKVFLILALAALITSCSLNDDDGQNTNYQFVSITNVDQLPDTLEIGESYEFLITSEESTCSTFFDLRAEVQDSVFTIGALNTITQGADCGTARDTVTNRLPFDLRESTGRNYEAYTFKFIRDVNINDEYVFITRTIPVKATNN